MNIELNFNAEEISHKLHEAIINSSFKQMFEKAAKEEIERLQKTDYWQGSSGSIITRVVRDYMGERIRILLDTEYKQKIDDMIREKIITGEKLDQLCIALVDKIQVKISDY